VIAEQARGKNSIEVTGASNFRSKSALAGLVDLGTLAGCLMVAVGCRPTMRPLFSVSRLGTHVARTLPWVQSVDVLALFFPFIQSCPEVDR
jgi:hypothetical protein